jgi:hypothetical protein
MKQFDSNLEEQILRHADAIYRASKRISQANIIWIKVDGEWVELENKGYENSINV